MSLDEALREAVVQGRDEETGRLTERALADGDAAPRLLREALIPAMEEVGARFRAREFFLPDVLLAARAMHAGLAALRPHLEGGAMPSLGTVVIGTVEGDLHDIGKNLVGIMLRGAGCEVVDLGSNVAPAAFVAAAREHGARVVGMSALLTTTMPAMGRIVAALRAAGLGHVKVIVGGAPLSESFAREIGADGYGYDAARACEIVRAWLA